MAGPRRRSPSRWPALRGLGVAAPPDATIAYAAALAEVGVERPQGVYWAGRATLVRRPEDVPAYDRAFAAVFEGRAWDGGGRGPEREPNRSRCCSTRDEEPAGEPDEAEPIDGPLLHLRWSDRELLRAKDFAAVQRRRARRGPPADGRPAPRGRDAAVAPPAAEPPRGAARSTSAPPPAGRCAPAASRCAPSTAGPATGRAAWCCSATCPARWRPTRGRWCASPTWRSSAGRRWRCSRSARRCTRITRELASRDPDAALDAVAGGGGGLVRRHPARRGPAHLQRAVGPARAWPAARWS